MVIFVLLWPLAGCTSNTQGSSAIMDNMLSVTAEPYAAAEIAETDYQVGKVPLSCNFHIQREFDVFISQAQPYDIDGELLGATVPHHLLAGSMIANFFATAAANRPGIETVIIIAPMHDSKGMKMCTTLADWAAPTGILPNERGFSEIFISGLKAVEDDIMMTSDHSAAALIPFVKHYFPGAAVATLLISSHADINIHEQLADILMRFSVEKNCLFVFSVDFSHYLNPGQTALRDMETREAVLAGDTNRIMFMNDANMDSPRAVCTFLLLTGKLGGEVVELDHADSLIISQLPPGHPGLDEGLTSYFLFAGVK